MNQNLAHFDLVWTVLLITFKLPVEKRKKEDIEAFSPPPPDSWIAKWGGKKMDKNSTSTGQRRRFTNPVALNSTSIETRADLERASFCESQWCMLGHCSHP